MALTVNLKPSGFQPVAGGSLIYQFTEASVAGKPNYRVELDFNGLGLPKFEFRPDAGLIVKCDIAPILASVLKLSLLTTDRLKNTYVKYQAVWDGGSDAVVSLTGDVIYFYVGNNHLLNKRTAFAITSAGSGPFLISTSTLVAWKNRICRIDFLHDNSLPAGSEIRITNPDASITTYTFTGNIFDLVSQTHTFTSSGTATIQVRMTAGPNTVYATITAEVRDEFENPVYLRWINDLGGVANWMFDYNQDLTLDPNTYNRYLTKRLYDIGVTYEQWIALNEISKDGVLYNDTYKVGQYLQDFTDSANPIDLIALPTNLFSKSKRVGSDFNLLVRYPEIQNSRVTQ